MDDFSENRHGRSPTDALLSDVQFRYARTPDSVAYHSVQETRKNRLYQPFSPLSQDSKAASTPQTNVLLDAMKLQSKIKEFLTKFRDEHTDNLSQPHYIQKLQHAINNTLPAIQLNCMHLHDFDRILYQNLVLTPTVTLQAFEIVLQQEAIALLSAHSDLPPPHIAIHPYNLNHTENRIVRDLNPSDIEQLVSVRGMVTRCSELLPQIIAATFRCRNKVQGTEYCNFAVLVNVIEHRLKEPTVCDRCQAENSFILSQNESYYQDKQLIRFQELSDNLPQGESPQTLSVYAYNALIDSVKPGDRVEVTGLYKAECMRTNIRTRELSTSLRCYVSALNFKRNPEISSSPQSSIEDLSTDPTAVPKIFLQAVHDVQREKEGEKEDWYQSIGTLQDVEKIQEFYNQVCNDSNDNVNFVNIYEKLTKSFAPSIFENEDAKKGILCLLAGGCEKETPQRTRIRNEINILMCGDPSTAKSQLLQHAHKISTRSIFTSGSSTSKVGLSAYISKDMETGELILESGALVLADRGLCCIDEFDKMDVNTRCVLNEAMEQQTVSVAKAGVVCSLNARTSVLACANPVGSKWVSQMSVLQNLNMPLSILSRFDLIYLMLDKRDVRYDRELARHLCLLYTGRLTGGGVESKMDAFSLVSETVISGRVERVEREREKTLTSHELSVYIAYCRRHYHPTLTTAAGNYLVEEYTKMRSDNLNKKNLQTTPRQLESLIRLSEALARLEWNHNVQVYHVQEAIRLMKASLMKANLNPVTGILSV